MINVIYLPISQFIYSRCSTHSFIIINARRYFSIHPPFLDLKIDKDSNSMCVDILVYIYFGYGHQKT